MAVALDERRMVGAKRLERRLLSLEQRPNRWCKRTRMDCVGARLHADILSQDQCVIEKKGGARKPPSNHPAVSGRGTAGRRIRRQSRPSNCARDTRSTPSRTAGQASRPCSRRFDGSTSPVPPKNLDPVEALGAEHEHGASKAAERIVVEFVQGLRRVPGGAQPATATFSPAPATIIVAPSAAMRVPRTDSR